ncbi:hypothetical protein BC936DRAFT_146857 [Jimgerdemannia flammicorona]|uniref:Uncharacterized protein n=1 Tax=Jimgerdemannia flammicorona TaxID=994334 RepID=A0A433D7D7_9FUNG|nr:hypothetical protein BC936DRAFT_146857 [Jimgerdemannia flammicorona]
MTKYDEYYNDLGACLYRVKITEISSIINSADSHGRSRRRFLGLGPTSFVFVTYFRLIDFAAPYPAIHFQEIN